MGRERIGVVRLGVRREVHDAGRGGEAPHRPLGGGGVGEDGALGVRPRGADGCGFGGPAGDVAYQDQQARVAQVLAPRAAAQPLGRGHVGHLEIV